ncbi:unnamed protein product, partial [Aureobasidium uvarum]
SSTAATTNNLAADLKPKGEAAAKAKDEKAARDECMLFSTAADPQADCQNMIQKYRTCMQGYGFSLP